MELIVLKGEAHSGKTATINYVYNELIKRNWKEVVPYTEISNGDFWAVLEKNEIRLGIVSQGDYVGEKENSVEKHLELDSMYSSLMGTHNRDKNYCMLGQCIDDYDVEVSDTTLKIIVERLF